MVSRSLAEVAAMEAGELLAVVVILFVGCNGAVGGSGGGGSGGGGNGSEGVGEGADEDVGTGEAACWRGKGKCCLL